ncbi:MAG: 30S ribosomal protein S7 [Candidatus Aenigmatarchaeota archaeon]
MNEDELTKTADDKLEKLEKTGTEGKVQDATKVKVKKTAKTKLLAEKKSATTKTPKPKAPTKAFPVPEFKLFGRWSSTVDVIDLGLKNYINLKSRLLPRSAGVHRGKFHKSKMHIAERLALHLLVSGHTGKRHRLTSGKFGGGYATAMADIERAFEIIEKKENKNPIEVLVRAIENAALCEEIISYQVGSIIAREAVITAPQRRIDKTLRFFAQGSYKRSWNKKKGISESLADELITASKGSNQSFAVQERERIEREAAGAR